MAKDSSRLRDIYLQLLESVQQHWRRRGDKDNPEGLVEKSKKAFREAAEFTHKEYNDAEAHLAQDIRSFAESLQESEAEFQGSLQYLAMQNTLWQWLAEISDKSQLEWHELAGDFRHHGVYHSGELVGLGQLECKNCHHQLNYYHPDLLPSCPDCNGTKFERIPFKP